MSIQDRMVRLLERTKYLHDPKGAPEDEGAMVKAQLKAIEETAAELAKLLVDEDQLPGWVQQHVAVAEENLAQVASYLKPASKK